MKSIIKTALIIGFLMINFHLFSQESSDVSTVDKYKKETIDLGFGIVQDKHNSTSSNEKVGSEELEQRAAINLKDALYGRLLGLTALKSSGEDGGWAGGVNYGANFNIRGIQTLTGEDNILILVDGLPRRIDLLTIDEVESVTVLKDAAALALYGYLGVNGAILVKTKRGNNKMGSKLSAKYNHKFTFGADIDKYADSFTYGLALNEARMNDGFSPAFNSFELSAFKNGDFPYLYPNVDWMSESMRDIGSEDILSVSYANTSERMNFFTMLNYTNSQGLLSGTETNKDYAGYSTQFKYSKANVRMNLDVNMTSTTKMELNLLGSINETNRPSSLTPNDLFSALNRIPSGVFPVRTEDGKWGGSNMFTTQNPVARIRESGYYRGITVLLNTDLKLTQSLEDIVKGLSVSARFGYDSYNSSFEDRNRGFAWARARFIFDDNGNVVDGDQNYIRQSGGAKENSLNFSKGTNNQERQLNLVLTSDYKRKIDDHDLAASLIYHSHSSVFYGRYNTFNRENIMSYMHYGFKDKYLADLVLTYTGSSRSYPQSWVFSPTLSLGWVLSEEDFLKNNNTLNFLKLRGSYGRLHTDNVPGDGSIWMDIYDSSAGDFSFTGVQGGWVGVSGLGQGYIPTTKFKLETANKFNLGLDAILFNGLDLTLEAYYQRRNNILMSQGPINSALLGLASGYVNKGVVDSKGLELGLNYTYQTGDLTLNLGGMYTVGVNKIIDAVEVPQAYPWLSIVGLPVRQVFGLEAIGFFQDQSDIENSPFQEFSAVRPGDIKYKVQKGDNTVNENDRIPIGYSNEVPKTNYAINAGAEYKGFGFNILFQGAHGFSQFDNYLWASVPLISERNITVDYYKNRWTPENASKAKYPALTTESIPNNERQSTLWYKSASFLKLRNSEIYYRFPKSLLDRISVNELKLSVRGENLYTWTSYRGDPEMPGFVYPILKGVSMGMFISF